MAGGRLKVNGCGCCGAPPGQCNACAGVFGPTKTIQLTSSVAHIFRSGQNANDDPSTMIGNFALTPVVGDEGQGECVSAPCITWLASVAPTRAPTLGCFFPGSGFGQNCRADWRVLVNTSTTSSPRPNAGGSTPPPGELRVYYWFPNCCEIFERCEVLLGCIMWRYSIPSNDCAGIAAATFIGPPRHTTGQAASVGQVLLGANGLSTAWTIVNLTPPTIQIV
jgi:hypothetical protein